MPVLTVHLLYILRPLSPEVRKEFRSCLTHFIPGQLRSLLEESSIEFDAARDLDAGLFAMAEANLGQCQSNHLSRGDSSEIPREESLCM